MRKPEKRSGKGNPDFKRGKGKTASQKSNAPFEKFIRKKSTGKTFAPKRRRDSDDTKTSTRREGGSGYRSSHKRTYDESRDTERKSNRLGERSLARNKTGFRDREKKEKSGAPDFQHRNKSPRKPFSERPKHERAESGKFDKRRNEGPFKPSERTGRTEFDRKFSGADKGEFRKRGAGNRRPFGRDGSAPEKRVAKDDFTGGKGFGEHRNKTSIKNNRSATFKDPFSADGLIRLNKYLSNAGVASRRDADDLIKSGAVKVNGVVVDQLGYKIKSTDKVTYGDQAVKGERKVYLLLNKPKDYITTMDDPQERKTVLQLIAGACKERIYPVGRLDRNTTGLLLFTNDGELAAKLTHPKHNVKKVYHVSLNKGLKPDDFKSIIEGIELEDGIIKADDLAFVGEGKKEIGIEIHSGRNRIVRRLFEHLGYDVIKLDRVVFAGLTKKDLPRGKHRFLTAKEIGFLQMIG